MKSIDHLFKCDPTKCFCKMVIDSGDYRDVKTHQNCLVCAGYGLYLDRNDTLFCGDYIKVADLKHLRKLIKLREGSLVLEKTDKPLR